MVQVTEVAKYFGTKRALGPVSFEIPRGKTVGFLGLNGVGKTTLLRILACDLRPSAGSVRIGGIDALEDPHEVRKKVGYLPEVPPLYRDMTVGDYLAFVGRIKGMEPAAVAERIPEVEERTRLTDVHDELTGNLSQGYRQRVGVAQAIIHDPELLILDEPTHDLDPVQIVDMREMVQGLKESHTILISSHILPEISETCDRLLILNDGEIVASGTEDELSDKLVGNRRIAVAVVPAPPGGAETVETTLRAVPGVVSVGAVGRDDDAFVFNVETDADLRAELCRALVEAGHGVVRLDRAQRELESVFVQLVGGVKA